MLLELCQCHLRQQNMVQLLLEKNEFVANILNTGKRPAESDSKENSHSKKPKHNSYDISLDNAPVDGNDMS